jgi:hypothetical protein
MLLDRRQRRLALAAEDLVEDRDVALFARARPGRKLERPRAGTLASWPRPISCLARASEMWASAKPSSAATASAKAVSVPAVAAIRLSTPRT